jgi:cell division protein FtsQ
MSGSPPRPLRQPGAAGAQARDRQAPGAQAHGAQARGPLGSGGSPGPGSGPGRAGQGGPPRVRLRAAFFGLAVVAIVAAVAWALLGSRFLIVRSVRVTGTGPLVSKARVLAAAQIPAGLPLIRVNPSAVAQRIERIQQVQAALVSRDWPDTIVISVKPRTPVFAVSLRHGYALVDAFGVEVRRSARRLPGFPLLTVGSMPLAGPGGPGRAGTGGAGTRGAGNGGAGGTGTGPAGTGGAGGTGISAATGPVGALRGSPDVRAAAIVLRELPPSIARQVRAVRAATPSEVSLRLADGVVIVWGGPARWAQKARELALLIRTHARVYDVSGPGTAVTKR